MPAPRNNLPARFAPELAPGVDQELWREYFLYSADFTAAKQLVAGTANAAPTAAGIVFDDFIIKIDSDSDFEFLKTMYAATDPRVWVRYFDDSSGRKHQRGTMDLRTVGAQGFTSGMPAGTQGLIPFVWPQPYLIAAASTWTVSAADFSGVANTARLTFHGNKVRPGRSPWKVDPDTGQPRRYRARLPYVYPIPPDGTSFIVPANGTVPIAAPIDMEADFLVSRLTGFATAPTQAQVYLQDSAGRERAWMDRSVNFSCLVGNGFFPNIFPSPRWLPHGSGVTGFFQDLSGAANTIRLYLIGYKLYE